MKLEVKNLSFGYQKGQHLWENVSFTVKKGEIFSILGANGAGKSTLLRSIIGFLHPETGSVFFEDEEGNRYDAFEAGSDFTSHIGYVPQMQDNAYSFALKDYVLLGCASHLGLFQSPSKEDEDKADAVMAEMGIYDRRDQPFNTLSGGQQRQAVIARAILQQPDMIVMDEPTNHLDYGNQYRGIQMIEKLAERGIAVILTTHMPDHALYLGDHTGLLIHHQLLCGKTKEVINEMHLSDMYKIPVKMVYVKEAKRVFCFPTI